VSLEFIGVTTTGKPDAACLLQVGKTTSPLVGDRPGLTREGRGDSNDYKACG